MKQHALFVHPLCRDLTGGVTQPVLQTGQDLPLLSNAAPEIGSGHLESARGPAAVLVVTVQRAPQFCLQGLDLLAHCAYLLLEGFPFGIGNEAVLGLRRGSLLNDLVDRIVFGKKLEAVFLAPTEPQTRDDFSGTGGGRQMAEHGNLLPVVAQK